MQRPLDESITLYQDIMRFLEPAKKKSVNFKPSVAE